MKFVMTQSICPEGIEKLKADTNGQVEIIAEDNPDPNNYLDDMKDADALIVRIAKCDAHAIENSPNLKVIGRTGVGYDSVDVKKATELGIPVVWNSSGYECVETLRMLDGLVQVYLPDLKYALSGPAARYSAAADYPQVARAAILEMYRQTGPFRLDDAGMLQRGGVIRACRQQGGLGTEAEHPGRQPQQGENTRRVIDWVGETFAPGQVLFSLMSQYTPVGDLAQWPELQHPISPKLNDEMYQYLIESPIADGFYQDLDAATGDMIPAFDGTGV